MSATRQRDLASQLAGQDHDRALKVARSIDKPWFRAQSLATIGRFASSTSADRILGESIDAAFEDSDPYRTAAVAAWPLRALVELKKDVRCRKELSRLLEVCDRIENPVCRCDALILLFQAVCTLGAETRKLLIDKAILASTQCSSWKCQRNMMDLAVFSNTFEHSTATSIVSQMADGRFKRAAERAIANGVARQPRQFFVCKS